MRKLFGFFRRPVVVSFLGLLALAALIWFVGPLISIADYEPFGSPLNRTVAILVSVSLWGLNLLRKWLLAKRGNQQLLDDVASSPGAPPSPTALESEEQLAQLRERFEEALQVLKQSRFGRHDKRQYLYELPWYIIIGPPGSGKTTALLNSGLHFPLGDKFGTDNKIRGVGGTRNCDWWFTDEAVLLDTAGRYTTQDSHPEVDRAAWTGFLELLKKHRKRRPINGAIIAVSVADLLRQTETEQYEHVRAIKERVNELQGVFGIRFPIYFLFTKCDLVAGFIEYFDDLGREDRAQVWGVSFPEDTVDNPDKALETFSAQFPAIEKRLNARVAERLQAERDPRRRNLIYAFPQQFSALQGVAGQFLAGIFRPSRFEAAPMLRGVYFTSGTQEGTPIDRLMGTLAKTFGLDRQALMSFSGSGRTYFLTRLFRNVIFAEKSLAGTNLRAERRRIWLQRGAYAGAVGLTLLAIVAWVLSYTQNQSYIADVQAVAQDTEAQIDGLPEGKWDLATILPTLSAVRQIPGGYGWRDRGTPMLMGLGLYQGDKLGSQAEKTYSRLLNELLLPMQLLRLEEQIRYGRDKPEYLYEALKVYLMFEDPEHFDPEVVKAWITLDWQANLPRQVYSEERRDLETHLDALLEDIHAPLALPLNTALVTQTRELLLRLPMSERIYGRLKQTYSRDGVTDFRITEVVGRQASKVFTRKSGVPLSKGVPALYTYDGYHKIFKKQAGALVRELAEEKWVLGEAAADQVGSYNADVLMKQVRSRYFTDYIREWDAYLADVDIVPFTSLRQAADVLKLLSGKDSPLRTFLMAASRETTLERDRTANIGVVRKAKDKLAGVRDRLSRILGTEAEELPETLFEAPVDEHFSELHHLVQAPQDGGPAPIEGVLETLDEFYVYLNSVAAAVDRGATALDAARQQGGAGGIMTRVKTKAGRLPTPLGGWLNSVTASSSALTLGSARQHVNAIWRSSVVPFYQRAIAGRYPMDRDSPRAVTLADFSRFFGPGGLVDSFFQNHISAFVDTSRPVWRWRRTGKATLGSSNRVLAEFQRAAAIRDTFFADGGPTPSIRFTIEPVTMDISIRRFILDLEGQRVSYSHGPVRPTTLQWPAANSTGQVRMEMSPPSDVGQSAVTETGPWAWFRVLDRAQLEATPSPERYRVTFELGGRHAEFLLTASSVHSPFQFRALDEYRCPERL